MKIWIGLGFLLLSSVTSNAQTYTYPYGDEVTYHTMATTPAGARSKDALRQFLGIESGTNVTKAALYAAGKSGYDSLLHAAEDARMDKQTGSTTSSSGTTSLVSKGVVPQVLGFAVEHGNLTETDNNTTATFRGTGLGVARLLVGAQQLPYCAISDYQCESGFKRFLTGTSFSVSLNTAQTTPAGSSASTTSSNASLFSGTANQVSGWSLRYDFHVRRKFSDAAYLKQWQAAIATPSDAAKAYLKSVEDTFGKIRPTKEYQDWLAKYVLLLGDSSTSDEATFKKVLAQAVEDLIEIAKRQDSNFSTNAQNLLTSLGGYIGARDKALNEVVNRVTYSVEYDNNRPSNQPSQSIVKFIVSGRPSASEKWLLTLNSSAAWYNEAPAQVSVSRFRYGQAALQLDRSLTASSSNLGAALSAGYYFQYMADNSLLTLPSTALAPGTSIPLPGNASVLLNSKGTIHIGQAQVTFSIKGTGIKFPVALSFSNRTELIKASNVVGHFGITYDLDSLFTKK
jgi:hypothetical protein